MELDILKIFVLTVHPCTVFIHVLLLGVNISHIHVSLLAFNFQFTGRLSSYQQTAIVVYKFNVTIFKVFLYYMLNFAGENLTYTFFKEHFKDP